MKDPWVALQRSEVSVKIQPNGLDSYHLFIRALTVMVLMGFVSDNKFDMFPRDSDDENFKTRSKYR